MASGSFFSRVPLLRLLPFMMAGIALSWSFEGLWWVAVVVAVLSLFSLWLMERLSKSPWSRLRIQPVLTVPVLALALSGGWICASLAEPPRMPISEMKGHKVVVRVENVRFADKSMSMETKVLAAVAGQGKPVDAEGCKLLLSVKGCDYGISPGDLLAFAADFETITNMGNPDEMDYAGMMKSRGFIYRQHLGSTSKYSVTGQSHTLFTRLAVWRMGLERAVLDSEISPGAQKFVIALMLGNNELIDSDTRQQFSQAGVAHVLALSGLHVGIIVSILWFFIFPLDYLRLKRLRLVVTLVVLILFDVLTGFSPSVARATVMLFFLLAPQLFHRKSVPLNSLCAAAIVILAVSPGSMRSVGFQLSFITVAAILLTYSSLAPAKRMPEWLKRLLAFVTVSFVASLSTSVLTAYYFNTVSYVSVLANVLVLPLFPVLLIVTFVAMAMLALGGNVHAVEKAVDFGYDLLNGIVDFVNSIPFGHDNHVWVSTFGVVMFYLILLLAAYWLHTRRRWVVVAVPLLAVVWSAHSVITDFSAPRSGLVVFNSFGDTPVFCFSNSTGWLWLPDAAEPDVQAFVNRHRGFLAHHKVDSVCVADSTCSVAGMKFGENAAVVSGTRIVAVGRGVGKTTETENRVATDWLIVTKRYHGTIEKLRELYDYKRLMLSGGLYIDDEQRILNECKASGYPVYNLKRRGAVTVME